MTLQNGKASFETDEGHANQSGYPLLLKAFTSASKLDIPLYKKYLLEAAAYKDELGKHFCEFLTSNGNGNGMGFSHCDASFAKKESGGLLFKAISHIKLIYEDDDPIYYPRYMHKMLVDSEYHQETIEKLENGYYEGLDLSEAAEYFEMALDKYGDNAYVLFLTGVCFLESIEIEQKDKGEQLVSEAAEMGCADAQYYYAHNILNTDPDELDDEEKEKVAMLYKEAASHGHADAQYEYAKCLEEGFGVEQNISESATWMFEAAENGSEEARAVIGFTFLWESEDESSPSCHDNLAIAHAMFLDYWAQTVEEDL